jgi:hypothetical protein
VVTVVVPNKWTHIAYFLCDHVLLFTNVLVNTHQLIVVKIFGINLNQNCKHILNAFFRLPDIIFFSRLYDHRLTIVHVSGIIENVSWEGVIKIHLWGQCLWNLVSQFSLIIFNIMILSSARLTASLKLIFSFCSNYAMVIQKKKPIGKIFYYKIK